MYKISVTENIDGKTLKRVAKRCVLIANSDLIKTTWPIIPNNDYTIMTFLHYVLLLVDNYVFTDHSLVLPTKDVPTVEG